MVEVKRLKLLRIRLWGCIIGSLVPPLIKPRRGPALRRPNGAQAQSAEPFKPIELEQAFNGAYRSYRVNGRPKIDVDTFFNRIRKGLIELIKQELKTRTSARIQTTAWIRFVRDDAEGQKRVELAFNSLMTSVYQGSEPDQIVDRMIANMKFQIENPALLNSTSYVI